MIPDDFTDENSALVQVMDRCLQATSRYMDQCEVRFLMPYDTAWQKCILSIFMPLLPPVNVCKATASWFGFTDVWLYHAVCQAGSHYLRSVTKKWMDRMWRNNCSNLTTRGNLPSYVLYTIISTHVATGTHINYIMVLLRKLTRDHHMLNSMRPRPNKSHFADDIFKCIFESENE